MGGTSQDSPGDPGQPGHWVSCLTSPQRPLSCTQVTLLSSDLPSQLSSVFCLPFPSSSHHQANMERPPSSTTLVQEAGKSILAMLLLWPPQFSCLPFPSFLDYTSSGGLCSGLLCPVPLQWRLLSSMRPYIKNKGCPVKFEFQVKQCLILFF